jgi:hypothetical protein
MTRWLVGAVAVCVLAGTAMTSQIAFAQEKKQEHDAKGQDDKKKGEADKKKMHEEKVAAFKKLFPTSKTSLAAAIDAAEKKSKGKAYAASFGIDKEKKLTLSVDVTVGDKFMAVAVDPATGVAADPKAEEDEDGDEDDEHEEHEKHGN